MYYLMIVLGFILGVLWVKSGEQQVFNREDYKKLVTTALTWWMVAYNSAKEALKALKPEETDDEINIVITNNE